MSAAAKRRIAQNGPPRLGYIASPETRDKLSKSIRRAYETTDMRYRIAEGNWGKVLSPETRRKMSDAQLARYQRTPPPFRGKRHTPEALAKISRASRQNYKKEKTRALMLQGIQKRFLEKPAPQEIILQRALQAEGINFRPQVILGNCYVVDLLLEGAVVVECDNQNFDSQSPKTKKRDRTLRKLGFSVLHIPYVTINRDLSCAVAKIKRWVG